MNWVLVCLLVFYHRFVLSLFCFRGRLLIGSPGWACPKLILLLLQLECWHYSPVLPQLASNQSVCACACLCMCVRVCVCVYAPTCACAFVNMHVCVCAGGKHPGFHMWRPDVDVFFLLTFHLIFHYRKSLTANVSLCRGRCGQVIWKCYTLLYKIWAPEDCGTHRASCNKSPTDTERQVCLLLDKDQEV